MSELRDLLDRMEVAMAQVDGLDEPARRSVLELLDGIDALHRAALRRLLADLDGPGLERVRADPAVAWLLDAYGMGVDERSGAEAALDSVRPFIRSHGGEVEVVAVNGGRVRVRMSGSCSGCTASAVTLTEGIEDALRREMPGFVAVEVEEDSATTAHPPPGETLVELRRRPAR